MITVSCRTNLDTLGEQWPSYLAAVPNVGDHIQSATIHRGGFQLTLAVCRVTWKNNNYYCIDSHKTKKGWYPHIELHMTDMHSSLYPDVKRREDKGGDMSEKQWYDARGSIMAFYDWYAPLIGTTASAFI